MKPDEKQLGALAFMDAESLVLKPQPNVTPQNNGELVIQRNSDTSLVWKYRGLDGVVRTSSPITFS
jgi:hypothetical protein